MQPNYVQRLRFIFSKEGPTRYIGHLDLARTLERSLNRAQIPVAYTQGFNPRPRMQLAGALSLGYTSSHELADIYLTEVVDPEGVQAQMMSRMAPGIVVSKVWEVPISEAALQTLTLTAVYEARPLDPVDLTELQTKIAAMVSAESLPRVRVRKNKQKEYDLRPLIESLSLEGDVIRMQLAMTSTTNGRPDEVLKELGFDPHDVHIHRAGIVLAEVV